MLRAKLFGRFSFERQNSNQKNPLASSRAALSFLLSLPMRHTSQLLDKAMEAVITNDELVLVEALFRHGEFANSAYLRTTPLLIGSLH
jgi:hypothetical protein